MALKTVLLVAGFDHMSESRSTWIGEYLALFAMNMPDVECVSRRLQLDGADLEAIPRDSLLVGHELPASFTNMLTRRKIRYVDIRISPIRFHYLDNILAIRSNDAEIGRVLRAYRISDHGLFTEAAALKLSFRYRDLGQRSIPDGSLVVFTERAAGRDSIHYDDPSSIAKYEEKICNLMPRYKLVVYLHEGSDDEPDPRFLRSLGAVRCQANLYAVLAHKGVAAITAIRSGVLEEARYFGVPALALDRATTPILSDLDVKSSDRFINITPAHGLSPEFWRCILHRSSPAQSAVASSPPTIPNLIRRALNNWNSSASGFHLDSHDWHELVQSPIDKAIRRIQDEISFREAYKSSSATACYHRLTGTWRWFTGERVQIDETGFARSDVDYGKISFNGQVMTLYWCDRRLTDELEVAPDGSSFKTTNQYGDGGIVERIET